MNQDTTIRHLFRKPKYPILVDVDGNLIAAKSSGSLTVRLSRLKLKKAGVYNAIDSSGEGWAFYSEHMVLTPLTMKKRWTKLEVIRLFNQRKNQTAGEKVYSEKSLSSKRFDRILADIVALTISG